MSSIDWESSEKKYYTLSPLPSPPNAGERDRVRGETLIKFP